MTHYNLSYKHSKILAQCCLTFPISQVEQLLTYCLLFTLEDQIHVFDGLVRLAYRNQILVLCFSYETFKTRYVLKTILMVSTPVSYLF